MPRISDFFGIFIYMYFKDHSPPHFHAIYGQYEAEININSIEINAGKLPNRCKSLVLEWTEIYQNELLENWELTRNKLPLNHIPPLE